MNQEQLLAKRDELVREYHLGELELYCTPMKSLGIITAVVFGFMVLLGTIASPVQTPIPIEAAVVVGVCILGVCFWYALDFLNPTTHVYVYTNGLVCFRRSGGRVVHWEEIRKVEIYRDSEGFALFVELNDNTRIWFPGNRSQGSASDEALQKFIEEKIQRAETARPFQAGSPVSPALLAGRYRIISVVSKKDFGAVYKAEDVQRNDSLVAIKSISLFSLSLQELIEATDTLHRQARLLSDLTHPNLPRVYEHFTDGENWYLTMDFIEGETLQEYLNHTKNRYLPVKEVLEIGVQLCDVLDYLHTRQPPIIFHDVKPANIKRTPGGQLYLISFGIDRHFTPGQAGDTNAPGTPDYAAPEQYGKAQTTAQFDIYSLGATLRYLLTGKDPLEPTIGNAALDVQDQQASTLLEHFLMQMLELDADKKPESMKVVKRVLLQIRLSDLLNKRPPSSGKSNPYFPIPSENAPPQPSVYATYATTSAGVRQEETKRKAGSIILSIVLYLWGALFAMVGFYDGVLNLASESDFVVNTSILCVIVSIVILILVLRKHKRPHFHAKQRLSIVLAATVGGYILYIVLLQLIRPMPDEVWGSFHTVYGVVVAIVALW